MTLKKHAAVGRRTLSHSGNEFPASFHHINCLLQLLPELSRFLRKLDQHLGNRFLEALIIDSVGPTAARDGGSTSEGALTYHVTVLRQWEARNRFRPPSTAGLSPRGRCSPAGPRFRFIGRSILARRIVN